MGWSGGGVGVEWGGWGGFRYRVQGYLNLRANRAPPANSIWVLVGFRIQVFSRFTSPKHQPPNLKPHHRRKEFAFQTLNPKP